MQIIWLVNVWSFDCFAEKTKNIVHICSSDTYPLMNKAVHSNIGAYLSLDPVENPGQTLVRNGNYTVDWIKHRSSFNMRCASRRLKLEAISGMLHLQGKSRQGKKVISHLNSWQASSVNTWMPASTYNWLKGSLRYGPSRMIVAFNSLNALLDWDDAR